MIRLNNFFRKIVLLTSGGFRKSAHVIIGYKKNKEQKMSYEWKHPNHYKELRKIREEFFKDQQSEDDEDLSEEDKQDSQK